MKISETAADLQFPATDPANVTLRAKFLLGVFPYSGSSGGATPPPPGPTPPAPTPPAP